MIVVVGIAGSGKSTQCQMLESTGQYRWLSVGQLLRSKVTDQVQKSIIESGDILDDTIVLPLIASEVGRIKLLSGQELLLDGFPRTLDQCSWLLKQQEKLGVEVSRIIHINVCKEVAQSRLLMRGRSDDHEAAINERFYEYEHMIVPILEFFNKRNVDVIEVNGEREPDIVHLDVVEAIRGRS